MENLNDVFSEQEQSEKKQSCIIIPNHQKNKARSFFLVLPTTFIFIIT